MGNLPNLTDQDWHDLLKRLTLYAANKARKLAWRGLPGGLNQSMPGGHGPDSLASEAIVLVLAGKRKCEAANRVELLRSLMDVVDSLISHLVMSAENRKMAGVPEDRRDSPPDGWHPSTPSRDAPVNRAGAADATRFFRERVRKALAGETKLEDLFECLDAGYTGRKEIAELMGVTEDEVTNLKKRLARKVTPLRIETRKASHGRA